MKKNSHLLDSLLGLQALDRLPRIGYSLRGVNEPESVAEHLFHTTFLVWALGREIAGLDLARALEIGLVHDLAETRLGDLPRTAAGYFPAGVKAAAERQIVADLLAPLPAANAALLDYQQGQSREAKLVGICDKLQLLIKAWSYRQAGQKNLDEFFEGLASFDDGGFEPVQQLLGELRRRLTSGEKA